MDIKKLTSTPDEMSALRDIRDKTFTPGPWKAVQGIEEEPDRWIVVADNGTDAYHIATVENGQPGDTCNTEGHTAYLIAAAPDLLAALIRCSNALHARNSDPDLTQEEEEAMEQADIAIISASLSAQ